MKKLKLSLIILYETLNNEYDISFLFFQIVRSTESASLSIQRTETDALSSDAIGESKGTFIPLGVMSSRLVNFNEFDIPLALAP